VRGQSEARSAFSGGDTAAAAQESLLLVTVGVE
jgi:hypothetical protein